MAGTIGLQPGPVLNSMVPRPGGGALGLLSAEPPGGGQGKVPVRGTMASRVQPAEQDVDLVHVVEWVEVVVERHLESAGRGNSPCRRWPAPRARRGWREEQPRVFEHAESKRSFFSRNAIVRKP